MVCRKKDLLILPQIVYSTPPSESRMNRGNFAAAQAAVEE